MRVVVFGATGVLGRQVIPRLVERGHGVRAVVRRPSEAHALVALGVEVVQGDILDRASVMASTAGCTAALHLATAIPKPGGATDWSLNDRIRREGVRHLLDACAASGCRRYIQQSIAFLCGDEGGLADEDQALAENAFLQSAHDMETAVRASTLDWCLVRGGLFYGPQTFEDGWRAAARAGQLTLPGDGAARLSPVHVIDMARAVVLATEAAPARSIYHAVDDEPVSYRTLFGYFCAQYGMPAPAAGGEPFLPGFAASNARIKRELGWQPAYPSYRSGFA